MATSHLSHQKGIALLELVSTKKPTVIQHCEAHFKAHQKNCSGFVKAVAGALGIKLDGVADTIVDHIAKAAEWTKLADGVAAKEKAAAGWLVIAGLKSKDHQPARSNGHVAVVVPGPLASGKYPTGYWGSSGGASGKNRTLNYSWNKADRDHVLYAAIPTNEVGHTSGEGSLDGIVAL